jgi:hypothetical protein
MKPLRIFLTSLMLAAVSFADTVTPAPHFTVQLHVLATGTSQESVLSDMTHALLDLKDVEVTRDGSGLWILYLNIAPIVDRTGVKGYALSTVIADQYAAKTLKELPASDFASPAAQKTVKDLGKELVDVREHLMLTCTVDGLPKAYRQIVDYFNQTYLMPVREDVDNFNRNKSIGIHRGF